MQGIKWIKEGSFNEKNGAPALKLIGEVQPINTVEVIKKEKINRLKEYPLSAKELADKVKTRISIGINDIWRIINETNMKTNPDYSILILETKAKKNVSKKQGMFLKESLLYISYPQLITLLQCIIMSEQKDKRFYSFV